MDMSVILQIAIFLSMAIFKEKVEGKQKEVQIKRRKAPPFLNPPRFLRRRATTVLHDDFSSGQVNRNHWSITINTAWYDKSEAQMYTPEPVNVYVKNGVLYLRPTFTEDTFGSDFLQHGHLNAKDHWGGCCFGDCRADGPNIKPIMSGMIRSKQTIKYGRVEILAKMARGDWFWNALWMMPIQGVYGSWPASGEFDLIEVAGNQNMTFRKGSHGSAGIDVMIASLHYGVDRDNHRHDQVNYRIPHTTLADDFHTYWLDWTESYIKIGIDDHLVLAKDMPAEGFYQQGHMHGTNIWANHGNNAPFNIPFNLIMNVHVGGNPFQYEGWVNHPYERPWDPNSSPDDQVKQFWNARHLWQPTWHGEDAAMQIKSVKMKQY